MKKRAVVWWPWVVGVLTSAIVVPITVSAWKLGGDVLAAPEQIKALVKSQEATTAQTTAIYEWMKQKESDEEAQAKFDQQQVEAAPPGYRWNAITQQYESIRRK